MFWLLLQRFSTKQTRKRMYKSKFSCWRCPQCIHWRLLECCLLWFLQAHQMCHLGHSLPGPGPQSVASIYMLCLSTVLPVPLTRPSFPVWIPALRSAPTFALDRACPPIPSHNLPTLLHSWLPDPQNKYVGWGCAQQYLVWLVKEISVTISVFSYVHIQKVRVHHAVKGASNMSHLLLAPKKGHLKQSCTIKQYTITFMSVTLFFLQMNESSSHMTSRLVLMQF